MSTHGILRLFPPPRIPKAALHRAAVSSRKTARDLVSLPVGQLAGGDVAEYDNRVVAVQLEPVVRVRSGSFYSCRWRIGSPGAKVCHFGFENYSRESELAESLEYMLFCDVVCKMMMARHGPHPFAKLSDNDLARLGGELRARVTGSAHERLERVAAQRAFRNSDTAASGYRATT